MIADPSGRAWRCVRGEAWAELGAHGHPSARFLHEVLNGRARVLCPFTMGKAELFVELIVTRGEGQ